MPIRVTCVNCHTRFNVSDKFAGKEGPCPKCKKVIRVPDSNEEIKIHAPESGPKDSQGRSILKPISRKETKISSVQMTLIIAGIVTFLVLALVMRLMIDDKAAFPQWLLGLSALVIAPAAAYAAYTFLRDQELGAFHRKELMIRIAICSVIYAVLWFAMPLAKFAFNDHYELGSWILGLVAMLAIGGVTGMYSLDFDYIFGLLHYGLYLVICLAGRTLAGIGMLPGMNETPPPAKKIAPSVIQLWQTDWLDLNGLLAMVGQVSQLLS